MTKRKQIRYDRHHDLYEILGIQASADVGAIQRAFRQRAKEVHPDRNPDQVEWANDQFRRLNDAYAILNDELSRAEYDRQRRRFHPADLAAGSSDHVRGNGFTRERTTYPPPYSRPVRTGNLISGPYRYVVAILGLVLVANVVFIMMTQDQMNVVSELRQAQTNQVNTLQVKSVFSGGTPAFAVGLAEPECNTPGVSLTTPQDGAEIDFSLFDIQGSAVPDHFASYTVVIEALDGGAASWMLHTPLRQPVNAGWLVKGGSIPGMHAGRYAIKLIVTLDDGKVLPPCQVIVRQKISRSE
jgi:hypothetical protein